MRALQVCVVVLLTGLWAPSALAQCADPPTSPKGRCIKANGGRCDPVQKIWVSPNNQVRQKCAAASAQPDRKR
jgi:hypothetical protein